MSRSNGAVHCDARALKLLPDGQATTGPRKCGATATPGQVPNGWTLGEFSDYCPTHSGLVHTGRARG